MKIRHLLPSASARTTKEAVPGFLLRNQNQNSLSFYTERQTRYEGWYIEGVKILERIEILGRGPITALTTTGQSCFWEYADGSTVGWKLLANQSGLTLSSSKPFKANLFFDTHPLYGEENFGRFYSIDPVDSGYLISYTGPGLKNIYIHIRTKDILGSENGWQEVDYPRDKARNSPPSKKHVFNAGEITTKTMAMGAGSTVQEAEQASLAASRQRPQPPTLSINHTHDTILAKINAAKALTNLSLKALTIPEGIYAGWPWFNQIWTRDELITGLGLSKGDQENFLKKYAELPLQNGELTTFKGSKTSCSDGIGWYCLLLREYRIDNLDQDLKKKIISQLEKAYQGLKKDRLDSNGFIKAQPKSTWMDTLDRSDYPLEIQCMFALLLEMLAELTGDKKYVQEQLGFRGKIKQTYWKNNNLKDTLSDSSIRPTIFLAYLLQPQLLNTVSWEICFKQALTELRNDWGGLSSLAHSNPEYKPVSSGEDNKSYHQGDSWFFINNLVAVALRRLNHTLFSQEILDILQSSTEEILWENLAGHPGEISSSQKMDSWGCGAQAFSGGTYLKLLQELEDYSEKQGRESISSFWDSQTDSI